MCIRDSFDTQRCGSVTQAVTNETIAGAQTMAVLAVRLKACLLITSDAADERPSVDLGGCRII